MAKNSGEQSPGFFFCPLCVPHLARHPAEICCRSPCYARGISPVYFPEIVNRVFPAAARQRFFLISKQKRQGHPCRFTANRADPASTSIRTNATKPVLFCCVQLVQKEIGQCMAQLNPCADPLLLPWRAQLRERAHSQQNTGFVSFALHPPFRCASITIVHQATRFVNWFPQTLRLPGAALRRRVLLSSCLSASA